MPSFFVRPLATHFIYMTKSSLTERLLTSFICLFLVTVYVAHGEDSQHSIPVPESVCKKMEILFLKYYPKVATTNDQANGIHFEYEVTTYEFPPADPDSAGNDKDILPVFCFQLLNNFWNKGFVASRKA